MMVLDLITALAEDAPIGIVVTDAMIEAPGPIIRYANPAFAHLVGRDRREVSTGHRYHDSPSYRAVNYRSLSQQSVVRTSRGGSASVQLWIA